MVMKDRGIGLCYKHNMINVDKFHYWAVRSRYEIIPSEKYKNKGHETDNEE